MVYGGKDTAKNTVAMMIINDKNLNKQGGAALMNPAMKQVGVAFADNKKGI